MQKLFRLVAAFSIVAALAVPAAAFTPIAQPDAAYLAATTLIPVVDPDFTQLNSITDGTVTVSFDIPLETRTVPGNFATWNSPPDAETATPRVLFTQNEPALFMSFSQPLSTFGFEAQPDSFSTFDMTAEFYNGAALIGTIMQSVSGTGGSLLFAASDIGAFTGVKMSMNGDFAVAQLRYDIAGAPPVPEPASMVLVTGSILGLLARRRARS